MRYFGTRAVNITPPFSDTRLSLQLTANTAQAFDWPTDTDLFRISLGSTQASVQAQAYFDFISTGAAIPTTGGLIQLTSASSAGVLASGNFDRFYQRPRSSTGFSVIAGSSFQLCMEFWSRRGTTG